MLAHETHRNRHFVALVLALALALCAGCQRSTGSRPAGGAASFRPTPLPGRLNIGGLGLGVRAETLDPSLLWNRRTHQGIHAFEVDRGGLTRLVDGLPLQRGTEMIAAFGTPLAAVEKTLGEPDRRVPGELRYDAPSRAEKVLVEVDPHQRTEFVRIQTTTPYPPGTPTAHTYSGSHVKPPASAKARTPGPKH